MADDGGSKKGGEVKHFKGWEGPWILFLGGIVLALLLLFAVRVPNAFCDAGPNDPGETAAACVRGWLEALGPWIAITVAWLALRPAYSQLSILIQQNAIGALAVVDRNIDQFEDFRISLVRISDIAVDFRSRWRQQISNNLDMDIKNVLYFLFINKDLRGDLREFSLMGHELKVFSSTNINIETVKRFLDCITILRSVALHCTSDQGRVYLINNVFGPEMIVLKTARDIDRTIDRLLKTIEELIEESTPDLREMEDRRSLLEAAVLGSRASNAPSSPADPSPAPKDPSAS